MATEAEGRAVIRAQLQADADAGLIEFLEDPADSFLLLGEDLRPDFMIVWRETDIVFTSYMEYTSPGENNRDEILHMSESCQLYDYIGPATIGDVAKEVKSFAGVKYVGWRPIACPYDHEPGQHPQSGTDAEGSADGP